MKITAHKNLTIHYSGKSAGNPSASQLGVINKFTLKEVTADEVYVRTALLAHSGIDRDKDAFDQEILNDFANTLPGKGLFNKHPLGWDGDTGYGIGRWFEAKVLVVSQDEARELLKEPTLMFPAEGDAYILEASYYLPRSEKNNDLIVDIDTGVASDVSIGFSASKRTAIMQDDSGNALAWAISGPGEANEGSLVWLGAQPGARTVKSASTHNDQNLKTVEDETVTLDELKAALKAAEATVAAQKTTIKANEKTIEGLQADLTKASGFEDSAKNFKSVSVIAGSEETPATIATVQSLIAAGKDYVGGMVDTIIAAKRESGILADDADAIAKSKAFYESQPIEMLKSEYGHLIGDAPAGSQLDGSEPNKANKDTKTGIRNKSVTKKALGLDKAA